jgi:pSer/pThr/pTyr-binding forkhead associated (FHA) protein
MCGEPYGSEGEHPQREATLGGLPRGHWAMGRLRQRGASGFHELRAQTLVGRGPDASIRLKPLYVSSQHASLRWTQNGYWELRDLQSKNGTYLNGVRVSPGVSTKLALGAELGFGSVAEVYDLDDVAPPRAMLVALGADLPPILLNAELIALPSQEQPEVSLFRTPGGQWQIESRERTGALADGELIRLGSREWRCCLPTMADETEALGHAVSLSTLADVKLQLSVSRDEEKVELSLRANGQDVRLGVKACYYLLLTLARCRIHRDLPASADVQSDGWIGVPSLLELLRISEQRMNVDIFRIRQELKSAGVVDAPAIIERDVQRKLVRLGLENVVIAVEP